MSVLSKSSNVISSSLSIRIISRSFLPCEVNDPSASILILSVTICKPISESVALIIHLSSCVENNICEVI